MANNVVRKAKKIAAKSRIIHRIGTYSNTLNNIRSLICVIPVYKYLNSCWNYLEKY